MSRKAISAKNARRIGQLFNQLGVCEIMMRGFAEPKVARASTLPYEHWATKAVDYAEALQTEFGIEAVGYAAQVEARAVTRNAIARQEAHLAYVERTAA